MTCTKQFWSLALMLAGATLVATQAEGQIISLNFSENSANQGFVGGELIGPLLTDSANWNNTNGNDPLEAGTLNDLIDASGANTGSSVTWTSSNTWFNDDGTADDEHRMSVGYLDDGETSEGVGVDISFSNIPYDNYRVYGLLGSDQGGGPNYTTLDFNVNGDWVFGGTEPMSAPAYNAIEDSLAATGSFWSEADGSTRGNYWTFDTTGSDLTIQGLPRADAERGSITAVLIRDLDAEIFDPLLKAIIDRDTGDVSLTNGTAGPVDLAGVGLLSDNGAWDSDAWDSIATTHDEGGGVSDDEWLEFSRTAGDLSEGTLGTGTLAQGQTVSLGSGLWTQNPEESGITFEYLDPATNQTVNGLVEFIDSDPSNGESPFAAGDFNFDGNIDANDWPTVRDNYKADLEGLTEAQAYQFGDLDGDGDNDLFDLLAFKDLFEANNPGVAFSSLTGAAVPEPGSVMLLAIGGVLLAGRRLARSARHLGLPALLLAAVAVASTAEAVSVGVSFRGGRTDNNPDEMGPDVTGTAGVVPQANWNNVGGNAPLTDHNATVADLLDDSGAAPSASVTWSVAETWTATGNFVAGADDEDRNLMDGYIDAVAAQPTATVQMSDVPYDFYDVYVYVGSDGDGRTGFGRINNVPSSDRWFVTSSGVDSFTTAADYIAATAGDEASAVASNYLVFEDVGGPNVEIDVTRGTNNVGIHAVQIVEELDPELLTLQVNTTTGEVSIRNDQDVPFDIDFFEITSDGGALDSASWSPLGTGTNDGTDWEALGTPSDSSLAQFFLAGSELLSPDANLSLGNAYQGSAEDLVFEYHDYSPVPSMGDFNNDGIVDLADYTLWRDNLGAADESAINNNGDGGGVTESDYQVWKDNFGNVAASVGTRRGIVEYVTSESSLAATQVPEPSSLLLVLLAGGGVALFLHRRKNEGVLAMAPVFHRTAQSRKMRCSIAMVTIVAWAVAGSAALATVTLDREYRFGEDDLEGPQQGQVLGSNNDNSIPDDITLDSMGPDGAFLDLDVQGNPTYENVGGTGLARPGAANDTFGARFDGDGDLLFGVPLNRPDELSSLPCCGSYPQNYTGIIGSGMQMWVYPDSGAIGSAGSPTSFQSIVSDTTLSGGPAINEVGQWTQINSNHADGADGVAPVPATVDVAAGDTWYHVMHHKFPVSGDTFRSVVYVDGIAVSANLDPVPLGGVDNFTNQLVVGATEIANDGISPAYDNHFTGVIDQLEMYVFGDNTDEGGQNWGTFDLFADNEWIAEEIADTMPGGVLTPGDVNKDGTVNGDGTGPVGSDDVSAFIAGWRSENILPGAHGDVTAGDWLTWEQGDLNHDGVTNFSDWAILRDNHPGGAALNLGSLLAGNTAVPEPSTLLLSAGVLLTVLAGRAYRRG